jgi:hypothetical protein
MQSDTAVGRCGARDPSSDGRCLSHQSQLLPRHATFCVVKITITQSTVSRPSSPLFARSQMASHAAASTPHNSQLQVRSCTLRHASQLDAQLVYPWHWVPLSHRTALPRRAVSESVPLRVCVGVCAGEHARCFVPAGALPTRSASCTAITLALLATRCAPLARYPLVRQGLIVPRESSCCPSITWESQCLSAPIRVATRCFVPGIFVSDILKMFPLASPLHQPHSTPTHTPTDLHPGMPPHNQHDRTHCTQRHTDLDINSRHCGMRTRLFIQHTPPWILTCS